MEMKNKKVKYNILVIFYIYNMNCKYKMRIIKKAKRPSTNSIATNKGAKQAGLIT